jgi:PKHD-type hydroxylase
MYMHIPGLLSPENLKEIEGLIAGAPFVEGNRTAGPLTKPIKNNLQLDREKFAKGQELDNAFLNALWKNLHIRAAGLPRRITPPVISRYDKGMSFGSHTDNPITGRNGNVRTDMAVAIFLSDPESYKGGALSVRTDVGDINFRLARGEALLFPAGSMRSIQEVTDGTTIIATAWIQSMIGNQAKRQLIFELDRACVLVGEKSPQGEETKALLKIYGDLMRMWSEV